MSLAVAASITIADRRVYVPTFYESIKDISTLLEIGRHVIQYKHRATTMQIYIACTAGLERLVKYYLWKHREQCIALRYSLFAEAIRCNWLNIVKLLYEELDIDLSRSNCIYDAAINGDLDLFCLLLRLNGGRVCCCINNLYTRVCMKGHTVISEILADRFSATIGDEYTPDEVFMEICVKGYLRMAQTFYYRFGLNFMGVIGNATLRLIMRKCCHNGEEDMVRWLFSLDLITPPILFPGEFDRLDPEKSLGIMCWIASMENRLTLPLAKRLIPIAADQREIAVIKTFMDTLPLYPSEVMYFINDEMFDRVVETWLLGQIRLDPTEPRRRIIHGRRPCMLLEDE